MASSGQRPVSGWPLSRERLTRAFLLSAPVGALCFWLLTAHQPLIDLYEFRQTQTALTALFMQGGMDGFLNYQTPVLGSPWSIPFEFPLFQWLVASLSRLFHVEISLCGRLLSVAFALGCLGPSLALLNHFSIGKKGRDCFLVLFFTSPIYLYWGRAFLVETCALFFALLALYCYTLVRPVRPLAATAPPRQLLPLLALGVSLSLSALVKAPTALPVLVILALDLAWQLLLALRRGGAAWSATLRWILPTVGMLAVAVLLLRAWTNHADHLKGLNGFARGLRSQSLGGWNYGSWHQRWSPDLWYGVVVQRQLTRLGVLPALALLGLGLLRAGRATKTFILAALLFGLMPLLLFSNLHITHSYYQTANQIFLLLALAAAFDGAMENHPRRQQLLGIALVVWIVFAQVRQFAIQGLPQARISSSARLTASRIIESNTNPDAGILVFGDDWNSAFAFHSKRRALAFPDLARAPEWSKSVGLTEAEILRSPLPHLGGAPLAAVVSNHPVDQQRLLLSCANPSVRVVEPWTLYLCGSHAPPSERAVPQP